MDDYGVLSNTIEYRVNGKAGEGWQPFLILFKTREKEIVMMIYAPRVSGR